MLQGVPKVLEFKRSHNSGTKYWASFSVAGEYQPQAVGHWQAVALFSSFVEVPASLWLVGPC